MNIEVLSKCCSTCKKEKLLDCFNNSTMFKDGKDYSCKECIKIRNKKYQQSEKYKEYRKKYVKSKVFKNNRIPTQHKYISKLPDSYLKRNLLKRGFSYEQIIINSELIEVQKLIIKTKRLCKTLQN